MKKLHQCTLIFILITNLTSGFEKYSAIPSHLKSVHPNTLISLLPK